MTSSGRSNPAKWPAPGIADDPSVRRGARIPAGVEHELVVRAAGDEHRAGHLAQLVRPAARHHLAPRGPGRREPVPAGDDGLHEVGG